MDLLAFKLVASPLLLLAASLAVRRWGESIGGLIVGLPLTSGPISVFLALERGPVFAQQATAGSLIATAAQAAFGLAYCRLAHRGWPSALSGGCLAFVGVAWPLQRSDWTQDALFPLAVVAILLALRWSPRIAGEQRRTRHAWWDLPARMTLMICLVVGVTAVAPSLGPQASGVLAAFPFMGLILAAWSHHSTGPGAAQDVMRGMVVGLLSFAVFFYALSLALARSPLLFAYGLAIVAALLTQAVVIRWLHRAASTTALHRPLE